MKLHPKSMQPVIYLSGSFGSLPLTEKQWLKRTKCKTRCFSFAYTCKDAFYYNKRMADALEESLKCGCGIMMDSGAFSFHQFLKKQFGEISAKKRKSKYQHTDIDRLRDETVELYVEYCKRDQKKWDFYVTFDFRKHCPTIYAMTKELEKRGIRPIPVYHGDQSLEWIERYCKEGYKLIGIGNSGRTQFEDFRYYYDQVFNITEKYGVKTHGLAVTSLSLMFQYPWYSVDSATWVKVAAYGKIIYIDPYRNVIGQLHVSEKTSSMKGSYNGLPGTVQKTIRNQVEGYGFDFDKVRQSLPERCVYNAYLFSNKVADLKAAISETRIRWRQLI